MAYWSWILNILQFDTKVSTMEISIDPVSILSLSVCSLENSQNSTVASTAFSFSLSLLSVIFSSYQLAETTVSESSIHQRPTN